METDVWIEEERQKRKGCEKQKQKGVEQSWLAANGASTGSCPSVGVVFAQG